MIHPDDLEPLAREALQIYVGVCNCTTPQETAAALQAMLAVAQRALTQTQEVRAADAIPAHPPR